jgi:hypothetical protein
MQGRKVLLAAVMTLALSGAAFAQDRDHDRDRDRARPTVQQNRRDRDQDRDRARAMAQFRQQERERNRGYQTYYPNSGYYPYSGYPAGQYGMYGYSGGALNQSIGYQDGFSDGQRDRRTGHSYRPAEDLSHRSHRNDGYYRQAYMQGYQQGWNSYGGSYRWPY